MKIIFLDVDGVLNHSESPGWKVTNHGFVLDEKCLNILKDVLLKTEAKIVLSSTWRVSDAGCKIVKNTLRPNSIIGKTPVLSWGRKLLRKDEILEWLRAIWPLSFGWSGEVITNMAVLDDDTDADLGDGSFFKTDFEAGGLTTEIADRIKTYLGAE